MNWAIDGVLVLIVAFSVWHGYKNGFIRGIFGLLSIVVAIYGANLAATTYSGEFSGMLEPFVGGVVDKAVTKVINTGGATPSRPGAALLKEQAKNVYDVSYAALRDIGVSAEASKQIAEKVKGELETVGQVMADTLTQKLCQALSFIAVFAIAFILIAIIFAVIGNILNLAFTLPGIDGVNRIIGLVLGLAKGALIVVVLAVVVRYLGLVSADTVEKTVVLNFLLNKNPLAAILGI